MARVLIVDDALFMRTMIRKALTNAGHEVVAEGDTGKVVTWLYGKHLPDLVLMDITMPDMDGLAALEALMAEHPEAKVIMCTALGQQSKVREALTLGARDYIVKPFVATKLQEAVARALDL
jgi:two-component system chemotaxis response regulator CheY